MRSICLALLWLACDRAPPLAPPPAETQCTRDPRDGCWVALPAVEALLGAQATDPQAPGYDPDAASTEGPVRTVRLPELWMARNELPTGAWTACVSAGACDATQAASAGPLATLNRHEARTLPLNSVTFTGATQVCAFLGGRLPTEDEWERAARGADGRRWPWGNEPGCGVRDPQLVPQTSQEGAPPKPRDEMRRGDCLLDGPAPHNLAFGDSPDGLVAMAGSLWEWTSTPGDQPGERRVRGGGWLDASALDLRTTVRGSQPEAAQLPDVGVRCVWGPP